MCINKYITFNLSDSSCDDLRPRFSSLVPGLIEPTDFTRFDPYTELPLSKRRVNAHIVKKYEN